MGATNTDVNEWLITDQPTHFSEWDSGVVHKLPSRLLPASRDYTIGAAGDSWLCLRDPTGRVSRQHARLIIDSEGEWVISDLRSKNGVTLNGGRQARITLTPGIEVGIGGIALIVESPLLGVLREILGRIVGWSDQRRLNLAVRSMRMAATRRESLQLCGDDDQTLVSVARLLHVHTFGPDRPFAICARRPGDVDPERWAVYDGVPRYESGLEALVAVNGGTLCVWRQQPRDFAHVVEAHREPSSRVQLIVCARTMRHDPVIAPIVIPSMAERMHEIDRIINAYAADTGAASPDVLKASDRAWLRNEESETLGQLETATVRLVLKRMHGTTRAAEILGMAHGSLSEWCARRGFDDNG